MQNQMDAPIEVSAVDSEDSQRTSVEANAEAEARSAGGTANQKSGAYGTSGYGSEVEEVDSAQRPTSARAEDAEDQVAKEEEEEDGEAKATGAKTCAEDELARLALAFFNATTKSSPDNEDILPQEDSDEMKLSVFNIFAGLFPEAVGEHGASVKNKRLRLHFNKVGYQLYSKEQSRRVPAVRAKPGNPGYGFRRARWRSTGKEEDRQHCEKVLRAAGCAEERIQAVVKKVQDTCDIWDSIRRPSRPAGPGRPKRPEDGALSVPQTPLHKPVSPKMAAAKAPKSATASKKKGAGGVCDNSDLPGRASASAKGKSRGSGCRYRKEKGSICFATRDDHPDVPNLVKDEVMQVLPAPSVRLFCPACRAHIISKAPVSCG
jgi:hypothetical protein